MNDHDDLIRRIYRHDIDLSVDVAAAIEALVRKRDEALALLREARDIHLRHHACDCDPSSDLCGDESVSRRYCLGGQVADFLARIDAALPKEPTT